ncbi:methyltransferase-domain-containing protein [Annulohypoxylon maeteangense]|uniref:methyltransferase-domain-containing protein n=1 Tax=Annulohypoxylon maeteangense TaxID=1927788 RepID=UPI0020086F09|nr:methyltransferase-domain-containing protein [Annulohypoxylon maeteangense]KAI0888822.1 methyltransferase-domain-containing protein [Annulohypoxylon maeteangense]
MFAVPGWAVSADNLKPEAVVAPKATPEESTDSRKRKRPSGPNVTSSNVADLWERVMEGRSKKKAKSDEDGPTERPKKVTLKEKKKLWKLRLREEAEKAAANGEPIESKKPKPTSESQDAAPGKEVKDKKKKKSKDRKETEATTQTTQTTKASAPAAPKLTPMQAAMREKLVSARFRHLNETLYTKPSADSFQLFQDSPEMFQEYHEGFRRQVDVWPENPVDGYIADIQSRGSQRAPHRSRPAPPPTSGVIPLPRTNGTSTIADLGCGDAKLASALQSSCKKLRLSILSYDLQSPSALVTKADIANLPLPDGGVDVVVFCLALMGTNWLDFVEEAYRILHWKGELWVAEIKSRFGPVGGGKGKKVVGAPVEHSVGHRRKVQGKKGKGKDVEGGDGERDEAELAIEVDGADDKREETDVTAFVEALRKRGFVLQGAVDLKNKMFVKMHFIKAASPTVGKGVVATTSTSKESSRGAGPKKSGVKFIDAKEQGKPEEENSILKPCVYKLR